MKDMKYVLKIAGALASLAFLFANTARTYASGLPSVSARAAVLMEADSGDVIFEKNASERLPMASTTKIMTALVALERGELDRAVKAGADSVGIEGSSLYLKEGDVLTMRDLLYALMLASANDAAEVIACEIGGDVDGFAALMNEKAEELGLESTHFTNPHGLDDEEHYTTARDLAVLASYALKNDVFREIVSTVKHTVDIIGSDSDKVIVNHNRLLRSYEGAIGVKTGFTKRCGRCLVSAAERDGVTLVAVTLNAPDDWDDHRAMLDLGFDEYGRRVLAARGEISVELPCLGGDKPFVKCSNMEELSVSLPENAQTAMRIEADRYFPAPVKKGDALATAVFYSDGREIAKLPLFAEHDVAESTAKLTLVQRILQLLGR